MNLRALLFSVVVLLGACGTAPVPELVAELRAAGVDARVVGSVPADPFSADGVALCVAGEKVRLYVFDNVKEARRAAESIDTNDPSLVGGSVVEWVGEPRFWLRTRMLVLYAGQDVRVEAALATVLGRPFARGSVGGRQRVNLSC